MLLVGFDADDDVEGWIETVIGLEMVVTTEIVVFIG